MKIIQALCLFLFLIAVNNLFSQSFTTTRDLKASIAQIPVLAETPDKGAFIDIIKAIDDVYPGKIIINLYPFARASFNVTNGDADFCMPSLRPPTKEMADKMATTIVTEPLGQVAIVVYSNTSKILTRKDLDAVNAKGGKFPYHIEVASGSEGLISFPTLGTNNFEDSLKKLALQRIDGIINAPEETDAILKKLKLKNIHRALFSLNDDVIGISKDAKGEEVNKILSECIKKLRASGRLQTLYTKVHAPYDNWQPKDMGW